MRRARRVQRAAPKAYILLQAYWRAKQHPAGEVSSDTNLRMQFHFLRGRMSNEYLWFSYMYFVIFLRIFRYYDAARAYHHIPRAFFWPGQAGLAEIRPRRARLTPGHSLAESLLGPGTSRASIAAGPG